MSRWVVLAAVLLVSVPDRAAPAEAGEALARRHCGACHLFPEPRLLDRVTWRDEILPWMRILVGLAPERVARSPGRGALSEARRIPRASPRPAGGLRHHRGLVPRRGPGNDGPGAARARADPHRPLPRPGAGRAAPGGDDPGPHRRTRPDPAGRCPTRHPGALRRRRPTPRLAPRGQHPGLAGRDARRGAPHLDRTLRAPGEAGTAPSTSCVGRATTSVWTGHC